mgnify:CR=1 FL=1
MRLELICKTALRKGQQKRCLQGLAQASAGQQRSQEASMAPRDNGKGSKSRRAPQKQRSQGSPATMPSEAVIDAQLSLAFDIMAASRACRMSF